MYLSVDIAAPDYEGRVYYDIDDIDEDLFDSFGNPDYMLSVIEIDSDLWHACASDDERFFLYRAYPTQGNAFDVLIESYPLDEDDYRTDYIFGYLVEYWEPISYY